MKISKPFTIVAATPTELVEVPTGHQCIVNYVLLSNTAATENTVTLTWTPNGASGVNLVDTCPVSANSFLEFGSAMGTFIVMNEGDTLTATTEAGSTFTAAITLELYFAGGGLTNFL